METLYIFLDEGGNFDFSPSGTRFFTLSSIVRKRPFDLNTLLDSYKYDLLEYGLDKEYFHCSEDNLHVRNRVFELITGHSDTLRIDSLIVDKRKAHPSIRVEKRFYPEMLGYLLQYVLERESNSQLGEVLIITDAIPLKRKLKAVEKIVKKTLVAMLPQGVPYRIFHHASKAHYGLQIADYCNWAIFRKVEKGDEEYYNRIKPMIRSEFDVFKSGEKYFY